MNAPSFVKRYREKIDKDLHVTVGESRLVAKYYETLLLKNKKNMFGAPRGGYNKISISQAHAEAQHLGLKDALEILFIKETTKGNASGSQIENASEDYSFLESLSGGLLQGPKTAAAQKFTTNSKTGVVTPHHETSSAEEAVKGTEEAPATALKGIEQFFGAYGIRLLEIIGGGILLLFGLYTLVKGEPPNIGKAVAHVV